MSIRPWPARERDLGALLERGRTDSLSYLLAGSRWRSRTVRFEKTSLDDCARRLERRSSEQ